MASIAYKLRRTSADACISDSGIVSFSTPSQCSDRVLQYNPSLQNPDRKYIKPSRLRFTSSHHKFFPYHHNTSFQSRLYTTTISHPSTLSKWNHHFPPSPHFGTTAPMNQSHQPYPNIASQVRLS